MRLNYLEASPWSPVYHQIDIKNATVKIKDGAGNEISVKIGEGNLTYTESRNIDYTMDRGQLDEVRDGDEVPMDVSFDAVWEYIKSNSGATTTSITPEDALKQRGGASGWTSVDSDGCRPYAVDIVVENIPNCSGQDKEQIAFRDFRYEQIDHDLRDGTLSFSGRCNTKEADISRVSQSSSFA